MIFILRQIRSETTLFYQGGCYVEKHSQYRCHSSRRRADVELRRRACDAIGSRNRGTDWTSLEQIGSSPSQSTGCGHGHIA